MKKLIIVIISLILLVGSATFIFYYQNKKDTFVFSSTINAVPPNASLIIECNNFYKLSGNLRFANEMWKKLIKIAPIDNIDRQLRYIDSLISKSNNFKNLLSDNSLFISVYPMGKDNFDCLYLLKLNNSYYESSVYDYISDQLKDKGTITSRLYNNCKEYVVNINNSEFCYYSVLKGVFVFSFSSYLVEDAIRQIQANASILNDKGFKKVFSTAGKNVDANIYINYKNFPKILESYSNESLKSTILSMKEFTDWSEFDVSIKNNSVLLNGFAYSNDTESNYLGIFNNIEPQEITIDKVLPSTCQSFLILGFDDFRKYLFNYKKFKLENNSYNLIDNNLEEIRKQTGIEIIDLFENIAGNEACIAMNNDKTTFFVLKIKSKSISEDQLIKFLKKYSGKKNISYSSLINTFKIDNETKFNIYEMPFKNVPKLLFGNLFSCPESKYFTFVDNFMIFGNSIKSLSEFLQSDIREKTLNNDVDYKNFCENLSSKSNFYFYSNFEGVKSIWSNCLDPDLNKSFIQKKEIFGKFDGIAYQFSSSKDLIYNNIFINYNPVSTERPPTKWETHLDTAINMKPFIVSNSNDNDKAIFIQDIKNTIYLINKSGRILWKKSIPEKISGSIYQIDYYNNKKNQLVFNSQNYIYIIDMIGNYIDRYPMKLQSPSTNGILVIDPVNNKNYKFFICCRDKKTYCYSKNGNIIKDWKFDKTDNPVFSEIQYFRSSKKDYIVLTDSLKTYILDLKGNVKTKFSIFFSRSKNNKFYYDGRNKEKLVTTDNSGNICYIYFDGSIENITIKKFSPSHYFDFSDVDRNGIKEFVFLDKNMLEIYKKDKTLLFSYCFADNNNTRPEICVFPDKSIKIGIVSKSDNKIYLFDKDGKLYQGFPLSGKTEFAIVNFDKSKKNINLIVGGANSFLYNYEIH